MLIKIKKFYSYGALNVSDDVVLSLLKSLKLSNVENFLDIGCGDGKNTSKYARACQALRVYGIEGFLPYANEANCKSIIVLLGDLESPFPFKSDVFDLVVINQVIEHIRDLDLFVSEVSRCMRKGGNLIMATPNLASWNNIFALILKQQAFSQSISSKKHIGNRFASLYKLPVPYEAEKHCHILTVQGVSDLLDLYGLKIVEILGAGYFPFPPKLKLMNYLDPGHSQYLIIHGTKH